MAAHIMVFITQFKFPNHMTIQLLNINENLLFPSAVEWSDFHIGAHLSAYKPICPHTGWGKSRFTVVHMKK